MFIRRLIISWIYLLFCRPHATLKYLKLDPLLMKFLKPVPAHYKVADKNCDCRELFRSSFCGAYPPHPPTHPVFSLLCFWALFRIFIFLNLDFILLEKLCSLSCKPRIMSLTLYNNIRVKSILPRICIHSEITWDSKSRDFELSASLISGKVAWSTSRSHKIFRNFIHFSFRASSRRY